MTILEINGSIKSKTAYSIPIKFGEAQLGKRSLFSYTKYNDSVAKEIRFSTKEVFIYKFDTDGFVKELSCYDSIDKLKFRTKFELISRGKHEIKFRDCTPGNGDGNHGTLIFSEANKNWNLSFHRVDSFLGTKKTGLFTTNDLGDFVKEEYYRRDDQTLELSLINEYEYFNISLDQIADHILENDWNLPKWMTDFVNKSLQVSQMPK